VIIALPAKDHQHLADALVRDLGFRCEHVDATLRNALLRLDPIVDSGLTMANRGPTPNLSGKLEQYGGGGTPEQRWDRLLHPPRPGSSPDRVATEVQRLLDVLRQEPGYADVVLDADGDVVVVGVIDDAPEGPLVVISGRSDHEPYADHVIASAGVVGEQEAIVAYVQELRQPKPMVKGDNEYIDPTLDYVPGTSERYDESADPDVEIAFSERETAG
jgi:hypothetical protein